MELELQRRSLNVDLYQGVYTCKDVVFFALWDLTGRLVGFQQYRPGANKEKRNDPKEGRYYTSVHGDKNERPIAVWGLESYHFRQDVLVICEGIFDACRCHNEDIPAVALLSSSYKPYKNWLTSTGRKIYKLEDDHGSKLGPYENIELPTHRSDLGDCTDEEIKNLLSFLKR